MAGYIKTLKNKNGDYTYPVTVPDAILDRNGNKVITKIQQDLNDVQTRTFKLEDDPNGSKGIRLISTNSFIDVDEVSF